MSNLALFDLDILVGVVLNRRSKHGHTFSTRRKINSGLGTKN
jgi:hypothetical protein